VTRPAC